MPQRHPTDNTNAGFTLVEMAIVLVVIGLIIGAILVGRDLIQGAELRATMSQIEKYNSAVNTFRSKFNGVPGDLAASDAVAFGFTPRAGSAGRGDGNGLIEGTGGANTDQVFTQESGMLWNDLSTANLINGNFTSMLPNQDAATVAAASGSDIPLVFPAVSLGRGNYVTVGSAGGINYWLIGGIVSVTVTTGVYVLTFNLTPIEGFNMDAKMDDGMPNTGAVQAHYNGVNPSAVFTGPSSWAAASTSGNCMTGGTSATDAAATYNLALTTGGTTPACIMRFRFN